MTASRSVNQAPFGTLVSDELRYKVSSVTKGSQIENTMAGCTLQTMIATNVTRFVVIKVTRITQTPYAWPRLVV